MDKALVKFVGAGLSTVVIGLGRKVPVGAIASGHYLVSHLLETNPAETRRIIEGVVKEIFVDWKKSGVPMSVADTHLEALPAVLDQHRVAQNILVGGLAVAKKSAKEGRRAVTVPARRIAAEFVTLARESQSLSRAKLADAVTFYLVERTFAHLLMERHTLIGLTTPLNTYFMKSMWMGPSAAGSTERATPDAAGANPDGGTVVAEASDMGMLRPVSVPTQVTVPQRGEMRPPAALFGRDRETPVFGGDDPARGVAFKPMALPQQERPLFSSLIAAPRQRMPAPVAETVLPFEAPAIPVLLVGDAVDQQLPIQHMMPDDAAPLAASAAPDDALELELMSLVELPPLEPAPLELKPYDLPEPEVAEPHPAAAAIQALSSSYPVADIDLEALVALEASFAPWPAPDAAPALPVSSPIAPAPAVPAEALPVETQPLAAAESEPDAPSFSVAEPGQLDPLLLADLAVVLPELPRVKGSARVRRIRKIVVAPAHVEASPVDVATVAAPLADLRPEPVTTDKLFDQHLPGLDELLDEHFDGTEPASAIAPDAFAPMPYPPYVPGEGAVAHDEPAALDLAGLQGDGSAEPHALPAIEPVTEPHIAPATAVPVDDVSPPPTDRSAEVEAAVSASATVADTSPEFGEPLAVDESAAATAAPLMADATIVPVADKLAQLATAPSPVEDMPLPAVATSLAVAAALPILAAHAAAAVAPPVVSAIPETPVADVPAASGGPRFDRPSSTVMGIVRTSGGEITIPTACAIEFELGQNGPVTGDAVKAGCKSIVSVMQRLAARVSEADESANACGSALECIRAGRFDEARTWLSKAEAATMIEAHDGGDMARKALQGAVELRLLSADLEVACGRSAVAAAHLAEAGRAVPLEDRIRRWSMAIRRARLLSRILPSAKSDAASPEALALVLTAYRDALATITDQDEAQEYGRAQGELAVLLNRSSRVHGRIDELNEAAAFIDQTIDTLAQCRAMDDWAEAHIQRGVVYAQLARFEEPREHLERAIYSLSCALGQISAQRSLVAWSEARAWLGLVLKQMAKSTRESSWLAEGVTHLRAVCDAEAIDLSRTGLTLGDMALELGDAINTLSVQRSEPGLHATAVSAMARVIGRCENDPDQDIALLGLLYDRLSDGLWQLGGHRQDVEMLDKAGRAMERGIELLLQAGEETRAEERISELERLHDYRASLVEHLQTRDSRLEMRIA